jgi:two-component system, chemotaxis family, CheB/CheR fusion protein
MKLSRESSVAKQAGRGPKPSHDDQTPSGPAPGAEPRREALEETQALIQELRSTASELNESRQALEELNLQLQRTNLELQQKLHELQATNDDLNNLLASSNIVTVFLDRGLRIRRFTDAAAALLRLQRSDIGRAATDLKTIADDGDLAADAQQVLGRLQPVGREVGDRDGRCYERRTAPYRTQDGRIEGVVVTWHDITELKAAERALQTLNSRLEARVAERTAELAQQQRLLQVMLRSVDEGVVVVDRNGHVLMENQAAIRIVGYSARETGADGWCEAVGTHAADGVTPLARDELPTRRALRGEEVQATELVLHGAAGDRNVVVLVRASPLRDEGGAITGAIANFSDITERKRSAEIEARLAALVRSARAAVLTWATDGRVVDWNAGAERLFGYSAEEICGRDVAVLSMAGERREFGGGADAAQAVYDRELVMRHKNGQPVHVAWTAAAVRDSAGRVVGAAGIGADISDRARLERQVAMMIDEQRQQLGRDLHDSLGQQLTANGLLAGTLKGRVESNEPVADLIDKLERGVDTAKAQLRAIVKGLAPVEIDASGLVFALDELAERTRRDHAIDCRLECPQPVPSLDGFTANQLFLIAREAVHNAVKHARPRSIVIRLENVDGVCLTVLDDGIGIVRAEDHRGDDAGLGLRIMRYRCRIIGGNLKVQRRSEGGTLLSCGLVASGGPQGAATGRA